MLAAVPTQVVDVTIVAVAITAVIAAGKAVYWLVLSLHKKIAESVVDAVVDVVSVKIDTITETIAKELKPNGGSSMFDKINKRFDAQDERLARNELRVATLTERVREIKDEVTDEVTEDIDLRDKE